MSKALYRKYRSKTLDEIVGQEHITAILKRAIAQDKVAHAYLLTGPKGVGKTSIARILAHAINGLPYNEDSQHLDIIEIDAASNNSVEDVRDLREKVQIAPSSAKRKVYIIDEVHMLSKQAFNALLKTLEEPPEHIVFILATTDADKLPATIISRVQRFNFRAINEQDAIKHLKTIAKKEKIAIDDAALQLIATHGKGSFRDSIGLLDQMQNLSDGTITHDMVAEILGIADQDVIANLLQAYAAGDLQTTVTLLNNAAASGTAAHVITDQLIHTIRGTIATQPQFLPLLDDLLDVTKSAWPEIKLLTALTKNTQPIQQATSLKVGRSESAKAQQPANPRRSELDSEHAEMNAAHGLNQVQTDETVKAAISKPRAERDSVIASADYLEPGLSEVPNIKQSSQRERAVPSLQDSKQRVVQPKDPSDETLGSDAVSMERERYLEEEEPRKREGEETTPRPFDWVTFTTAVQPKAGGAFIILKNCSHDYDSETLTIYAGNKFNKNKLDKAAPDLSAALASLNMHAEIIITATAKPPEDATTAAILDMMGGGEEL